MTKHEQWREKQIYEKGDIQRKAEINLEKQQKESFSEVVDERSGVKRVVKRSLADILKKRHQAHSPKMVFMVPDLSHIDWNN